MKTTSCTCKRRFTFELFGVEYLNGCPVCRPDLWRQALEAFPDAQIKPLEHLTWAEVEPFLQAICNGEITLTVDGLTPANVYCGNVKYNASNGWTVKVFNGCGEFKYISDVEDPSGKFIEYDAMYWQETDEMGSWRMNDGPDELKQRKDAGKFHPHELNEAELALWHWS